MTKLKRFHFLEKGAYSMEEICDYLASLQQEKNSLLTEMEHFAKIHHIPIMEHSSLNMMIQFLRIQQPKRILEIGTAIGYSALRMADALPNVHIVTVEREAVRCRQAHDYISRAHGAKNRITIIEGDALEVFAKVKAIDRFDAIFIDAAKGQYRRFFELYTPLLQDNGCVYTDNVLYKGLVAKENIESRRASGFVKKIKAYNQWLMDHPAFITEILPVGDGVAVSLKKA